MKLRRRTMKNKYSSTYKIWVYPSKDTREVINGIINRIGWMIGDSGFLENCDSWVAVTEWTAQNIGISENIPIYFKYWIIVLIEEYLCSQIAKSNERISVSLSTDTGQNLIIIVEHEDFKEQIMFVHNVRENYKSRVIDFEKENEDD
jgi:hypothetical protein